jgi:hypothetical protein
MRNWMGIVAVVLAASACSPAVGMVASTEKRVWMVKGEEVYRCADGAQQDQPPKPICVRAPLVKEQ